MSKVNKLITVDYAITFTLRSTMYKYQIEVQKNKAHEDIALFIKDLDACGIICTEITPNGNVHFHGLLNFRVYENIAKRIDFYVKDYFRRSKVIGFTCLKQITEFQGWIRYCLGEYSKTKDLLNSNPIIYNKSRATPDQEIDVEFGIIKKPLHYISILQLLEYSDQPNAKDKKFDIDNKPKNNQYNR